MEDDRRLRLWRQIVGQAGGEPITLAHVCGVMLSAAGVDAVAVTAKLEDTERETVYTSSRLATDMEDLTVTLGEGPGVDALSDGHCLVTDLAADGCRTRWPGYAPAAVEAGVGGLFAFPLRLGGVGVGVLCLYRGEPGPLGSEQLADALVLTDTVLTLLLDKGLSEQPELDGRWSEQNGAQHPEVHQATGMITVQLGVSAAAALVRLRAYAFSRDRRLSEVAKDVVARRLHFGGSES
ncbi:GAF domain-containing protein [Streptomyces sp. AA1529]|uniref:GAF domain-containing protein n=1 Tax=Streptomyces sp. AA1529 TaxID=1203257 RepID=UPI00035E4AA6|nr:GAF domain-containing protein [Streptomyces sp. AA1529]